MIADLVDLFATEGVIKFLHVLLRDEAQLFVAERGLDMIFYIAFITGHRALAQSRLSVFRKPLVHPLVERDVAVLGKIRALIIFNRLAELRHKLLLRFCEHAFVYWRIVILVSDNDSSFPSSVSSFADKSVAVRSFSGYYTTSSATQDTTSFETYPDLIIIITVKYFFESNFSARSADIVDRLVTHTFEYIFSYHSVYREHPAHHLKLNRVTEQAF